MWTLAPVSAVKRHFMWTSLPLLSVSVFMDDSRHIHTPSSRTSEENADLVGAINILAAGHAVLACGGMAQSGRPAKQEPTEATTQGLALV